MALFLMLVLVPAIALCSGHDHHGTTRERESVCVFDMHYMPSSCLQCVMACFAHSDVTHSWTHSLVHAAQ
jgi:hypothetical protein